MADLKNEQRHPQTSGERDDAGSARPAERAKARPTSPPKRQKPETLLELYTFPKSNVREFLTALATAERWGPKEEELRQVEELLLELDPSLRKTRTLALHAATAHDRRFAAPLEPLFIAAVEKDFSAVQEWPPGASSEGRRTFEGVLDAVREEIARPHPPPRLFNAVMIAQSVLSARYSLETADAVLLLSRALGPPQTMKGRQRNPRLSRLRAIGDPQKNAESLRTLLDLLTPWVAQAQRAEVDLETTTRKLRAAEARAVALKTDIQDLKARLQEAHDAEMVRTQELRKAQEREHGAGLARKHEASQIREQILGFLEDEVLARVNQVREALTLDPPRVPYSQEQLEDLVADIHRSREWLNL